jgi:hypothetical protein
LTGRVARGVEVSMMTRAKREVEDYLTRRMKLLKLLKLIAIGR